MQVIELKTRPKEVVASVIEKLEEALESARNGHLVSVALATANVDGSIGSCWSETDDIGRLLGSVTRLQHRLLVAQDV